MVGRFYNLYCPAFTDTPFLALSAVSVVLLTLYSIAQIMRNQHFVEEFKARAADISCITLNVFTPSPLDPNTEPLPMVTRTSSWWTTDSTLWDSSHLEINFDNFGGDPGRVTIFEESAGGISVSAQVMSPYNSGLLRAAIAQSGSALKLDKPGAERRFARNLAVALDCPPTLDQTTLQCLQNE